MSRTPLAAAAAAFALVAAGPAAADGPAIEIAYAPSDRELTVTLPPALDPASEVPDWLSAVDAPDRTAPTVYRGTLPEIGDRPSNLGATESEAFMLGQFAWLPQADLILSAPEGHHGVATGTLLSRGADGAEATARYRPPAAASELSVFFGPYEIGETPLDLTEGRAVLRTYFKADQADRSAPYLEAAARHIARYDARIGPYPYDGFAVVTAPIPVGYGLPGMTFVGERILGHPYMLGRSLAHEVLHSWWGGAVRVDYAAGNWAEGLTTYQADHALAASRDPAAARAMRRDWLSALTNLPEAQRAPAREFVSAGHDRDQSIGYGKVAMIFHMLRNDLGAEAFDAGLRAFWQAHRGGVAGWDDLQTAFQGAAGADLSPFFAQWLDRTGLPEVRPAAAASRPDGAGHIVTLDLRQTGQPYRLSVPVVIETEDGPERRRVRLEGPAASAELRVDARPVAVAVDPDFDVARRLAEGELPPMLRDVLRAGAPALLADGDTEGAPAVVAALFGDAGGIDRAALDAALPDGDALVAVGETGRIAALRTARLPGPALQVARQGSSRAWVERGPEGRPWLFVSADDPADLADDFGTLGFYGARSYVVFEAGAPSDSGRWPVTDSPMRLALD